MLLVATTDTRSRHLALLFTVAALLHGVADPAITYLTIIYFGIGYESNPWLRSYLHGGLGEFTLIHLPLYLILVGAFVSLLWLMNRASDRDAARIYRLSRFILGGTIVWGVLLFLWNLSVLLNGLLAATL